jgi:hypothetical protein
MDFGFSKRNVGFIKYLFDYLYISKNVYVYSAIVLTASQIVSVNKEVYHILDWCSLTKYASINF